MSRLLFVTSIACLCATFVGCGGSAPDKGGVRAYRSSLSFDGKGHWPPPRLHDAETVTPGPEQTVLRLDPSRVYLVRVSRDKGPRRKGLIVHGGHNVVIVGGEIRIGWQGEQPNHNDRRGLLLKDQTGVAHVEGLRIGGRDLGEGIDLDQRKGATVQLVNVSIGTVRARDERNFSDTHPDLVQSWAGPRRLRIDGLRGRTGYQGLFLLPRQFQGDLDVREIDLRNISITGTKTSRYLLWVHRGPKPRLRNVWLRGAGGRAAAQLFWPRPQNWSGARLTRTPTRYLPRRPAAGGAYAVPSKREEGRP
jgi:hypothetical protein